MTYQELVARLRTHTPRFSPFRDPAVEYARFPAMARIYKATLGPDGMPPTQEAFAEAVAAELPALAREAVLARACRTYPSLVRQQHFELVLRGHFRSVITSSDFDLAGIDFVVIDRGRWYGIGLRTDTWRSHKWHEAKQTRHSHPPFPVLDLYVEPDRYKVGDFWLHPPEQVEEVRGFIERERKVSAS
jgi:hypothetical protein